MVESLEKRAEIGRPGRAVRSERRSRPGSAGRGPIRADIETVARDPASASARAGVARSILERPSSMPFREGVAFQRIDAVSTCFTAPSFPIGRRNSHVPARKSAGDVHDRTGALSVEPRPPLPPFDRDAAIRKIRAAEDGWNSRDPARVALAYTQESVWRNRSEFIRGRAEIVAFLTRKWRAEYQYRLVKELWAFGDDRIAVRFAYEWHDASGAWHRSYGNENWEFDAAGLMRVRHASINDVAIAHEDRTMHWDAPGPRPPDHPGLSELGL
jgi:nuclear transport factor 2 (NTF2) superfamily protein